jgi:hypothetical protein
LRDSNASGSQDALSDPLVFANLVIRRGAWSRLTAHQPDQQKRGSWCTFLCAGCVSNLESWTLF